MNEFFVRGSAVFSNPLIEEEDESVRREGAAQHPVVHSGDEQAHLNRDGGEKRAAKARRRLFGRLVRTVVFLVLAFSVAHSAQAQETVVVTDDEVNAIANKLYCPVCENITLDTCGTAACADWRYEIRLQLEQGKTEDEIIADFVKRFGDRVVGTPVDPVLRAVSLVTPWLIVGVALIIAGAVLVQRRSAQTRAARRSAVPSVASAPGSRFADQFEKDLSD